MNTALTPANFIPFTIPAFSATGLYGSEIQLDPILEAILTISPIPPFSHPEIRGSYFDGHVPSSSVMAFANMRDLIANHLQHYWNMYGVFHLVSTHNNHLTRKGDNMFPGELNNLRVVFVVRPTKQGWTMFVVSLALPVAVTPKYRLILPYNPVS